MRGTAASVVRPGGGVKTPPWPAPPTAGDIVLVTAVLLAAAGLLAVRPGGGTPRSARVQVGDEVVHMLPLDRAARVEVSGPVGVSRVAVEDGRVRVLDSSCVQRICVRRGWLREVGDVAACVPNRLVVRVEGEGRRPFDGVSR